MNKLVTKIVMLYISARLRLHACSANEPRPHLFVDSYYGDNNYLASVECLRMVILHELTVLRRLQTPICVLRGPYGRDTLASAWSRALAMVISFVYYGIFNVSYWLQ